MCVGHEQQIFYLLLFANRIMHMLRALQPCVIHTLLYICQDYRVATIKVIIITIVDVRLAGHFRVWQFHRACFYMRM